MTIDIHSGFDYQVITVWDNEKYADEIINAYIETVPSHILKNVSKIKKGKGIRPVFDEKGCGHIWKYVLLGVALINEKGKIFNSIISCLLHQKFIIEKTKIIIKKLNS